MKKRLSLTKKELKIYTNMVNIVDVIMILWRQYNPSLYTNNDKKEFFNHYGCSLDDYGRSLLTEEYDRDEDIISIKILCDNKIIFIEKSICILPDFEKRIVYTPGISLIWMSYINKIPSKQFFTNLIKKST